MSNMLGRSLDKLDSSAAKKTTAPKQSASPRSHILLTSLTDAGANGSSSKPDAEQHTSSTNSTPSPPSNPTSLVSSLLLS